MSIEYQIEGKRESEIERKACEYAEARGWMQTKLMRCSVNGWPDRIFHRRGITMYIEFKAPGEPATRQQLKRHRELRAHGIPVHVCDNLEDAREILR